LHAREANIYWLPIFKNRLRADPPVSVNRVIMIVYL